MVRFDTDSVFGDDYLYFYGPTLTEERNVADAEEIIVLLDLRAGSRVLDAPCGHGRIANLLAAHGCAVTGVDSAESFLAVARDDAARRGVSPIFVHGDLRSLPADLEVDAAVCWFTSFGYFDDPGNHLVLREFRRVLRPGGRLLIETLHQAGFLAQVVRAGIATQHMTRVGDDLLIDETTYDATTGRMETDRTTVRDGRVRNAHYSVRVPTAPELTRWLLDAGFDRVHVTGRGGAALTAESRRLVAVAV